MRPIFKTKMLIYLPQANLDDKILFGKITHHLDPEIRAKCPQRACLGTIIPHSMSSCSETCKCNLQCHINHEPEWNVESSIPIQIIFETPYRSVSDCGVSEMCDATKQNLFI